MNNILEVVNLSVQFKSKKDTFNEIIGGLDKPSGLIDHFSSLKDLVELSD